jgi:uncharacterized membrane protein YhaH (DUF805 family)
MNWYLKVLKQYADFNGRARRQEYWMFALFNFIAVFALAIVGVIIGGVLDAPEIAAIPYLIYVLGVLIPGLAVAVRRLHDQNKSGWYYCVAFIPLVGSIWLIVLLATEGDAGPNQYGPDPKNPNSELNDIGLTEA